MDQQRLPRMERAGKDRMAGSTHVAHNSAEAPMSTYIVYSPAAETDFFCFEPVTHPVDAHNLPGGAEANGLIVLEPAEEMSISCRFAPGRPR